jgi:hypothetical protein
VIVCRAHALSVTIDVTVITVLHLVAQDTDISVVKVVTMVTDLQPFTTFTILYEVNV